MSPLFRRRRDPAAEIARLRAQREQVAAELDAVSEDAAWAEMSDERLERSEGSQLARQAKALRAELARIDQRLLRAELDAFD
jgi:hypothetical protein